MRAILDDSADGGGTGTGRLTIRVDEETIRAFKSWCALRGITMQDAIGARVAKMVIRMMKGEAVVSSPAQVVAGGQTEQRRPADPTSR